VVNIRAFLSRNLPIKLLSAFIGLFIWFWVNITSDRIISSSLTCKVRFYNAPPSLKVEGKERMVKLYLKGKRLDIIARLDKIVAFVDISKAGNPPAKIDLPVETFIPGDIEVVEIQPETISVSVSNVATNTLHKLP